MPIIQRSPNSSFFRLLTRILTVALAIGAIGLFASSTASAGRLKWDMPVTLDATGGRPHLALSDSGKQIAVWEGGVGLKKSIRVATRSRNGAWSKPVDVSPAERQFLPVVAIDQSGRGVIAWAKTAKDNQSSLFISREQPDGSWTQGEQLTGPKEWMFETSMHCDPSGRILIAWTSGGRRNKTAVAKAAFLTADTPASQVQIKQLPSEPGTHVAIVRPHLIRNGPAVVILESQRRTGGATTFSETVQSADGEWSRLKDFHTTSETEPLGVTSNGAGEVVVCWATSETDGNFHSFIRSASGEWTAAQDDLKLNLAGSYFSVHPFGHNEFILNFEECPGDSSLKIVCAYLKSGYWYRKELRPRDKVARNAGDSVFCMGMSDPSGSFRLFWSDPERTKFRPNITYSAQIDEAEERIEETAIGLTSPHDLRLRANSVGEVCALYEFWSAPDKTGIKVATATTITDSEAKGPASHAPTAATDSLPPLSPASAASSGTPATSTQPSAHTTKYPIEIVKTDQTNITPRKIALDPITTNWNGSPSLLVFDPKQRKLFRLLDGKLEHIAGDGGELLADTKSSSSKTPRSALQTPLDRVQAMSVFPNGRIAISIEPTLSDPGRIIALIPNKTDLNRYEVEDIARDSSSVLRNTLQIVMSLIPLQNDELLFSSLNGIYRVDNKNQVTREQVVRTFSSMGSGTGTTARALAVHLPILTGPTNDGKYLLTDPWFHRIYRLSGDLQTWERVAGQGDLNIQRHLLPPERLNQGIDAAKGHAKKQFAGVSPDGTEASKARLTYPLNATEAPDGTIVLIENGKLRGIDRDGKLFTIASAEDLGIATQQLESETRSGLLHSLTISPDGDCYVAQEDLGRILKIKTGFVPRVSTVGGFQMSVMSFPRSLAPILHNHKLGGFWVTEALSGRILQMDVNGKLRGAIGGRPAGAGEKDDPDHGVDLGDGSDSSKWRFFLPVSIRDAGRRSSEQGDCEYLISDFGSIDSSTTGFVRKLSADGKTLTTVAGNGKPAGSDLTIPPGAKAKDIAIRPLTAHPLAQHDEQGNTAFFVADTLRKQVLWIKADGTAKPAIGGGTLTPTPDWQPATKVQIGEITRIRRTQTGALLADKATHRIYEYNQPNQQLRVIAGTGTAGYSGDNGPATQAQLNKPHDFSITNDKILITDTANHVIREINTTTNTITTIAGTGTPGNTTNTNNPLQAQFNHPTTITLSKTDIYILDTFNKRITKIKREG